MVIEVDSYDKLLVVQPMMLLRLDKGMLAEDKGAYILMLQMR